MNYPAFLFITCQVGAEGAVKQELAAALARLATGLFPPRIPHLQAARRRLALAADFDLESVFARAYGFSLGKVQGDDLDELARAAWQLFGRIGWPTAPACAEFTSGRATPRRRASTASSPASRQPRWKPVRPCCVTAHTPDRLAKDADDRRSPRPGEMVMDCILVEPDQWWIGYHQASGVASRWPGGMLGLELPANAVSRAWLKMEEALRWSELPIAAGARCAEIGSAPGGASQALLDHGILVTGIDPAEMAPEVLQHPNFTHLRRRANQVRRREFPQDPLAHGRHERGAAIYFGRRGGNRHASADQYSRDALDLETVSVGNGCKKFPTYLARIREWGYNYCSCSAIAIQPPGDLRRGNPETISSQADISREISEKSSPTRLTSGVDRLQ